MRVLIYYAHPGHRHSTANRALMSVVKPMNGITWVDLYAEYPRHNIDVAVEQSRLNGHDAILFQFPLFWYSAPSLVKEWQDLVLQYGYAYGEGGDALKGKHFGLVLTTGSQREAYQSDGFQKFPLTTFLTPFQRTAELCQMDYLPPYVLHSALRSAEENGLEAHANCYQHYVQGLRDDTLNLKKLKKTDILTAENFIKGAKK